MRFSDMEIDLLRDGEILLAASCIKCACWLASMIWSVENPLSSSSKRCLAVGKLVVMASWHSVEKLFELLSMC